MGRRSERSYRVPVLGCGPTTVDRDSREKRNDKGEYEDCHLTAVSGCASRVAGRESASDGDAAGSNKGGGERIDGGAEGRGGCGGRG